MLVNFIRSFSVIVSDEPSLDYFNKYLRSQLFENHHAGQLRHCEVERIPTFKEGGEGRPNGPPEEGGRPNWDGK
jgi:hypothetical protein